MSLQRRSYKASSAGLKKVPASVQLLEARLTSFDPEIREQAWKSIHTLGAPDDALVEKCMEFLDFENWFVREAGVKAIGHCVDAGCGVMAGKAVEPFLEHTNAHIRFCGGQGLCAIEERVRPIVEELQQQRADAAMIARAAAPAENAAEMLAERLTHEDPKVRQNALKAISAFGSYCIPHAPAMMALITDVNLQVRNETIKAVKRLGKNGVDGVGVLAAGLGHEDEKVRRSAKRALLELAHTNGHDVAASLTEPLKSENRITRLAVLDCFAALGVLCAPYGTEISSHLEEMDVEVRLAAVRSLISAGKAMQSHYGDIRKKLKHKHPDVQRAAVQALRGLASVCPKVAKSAYKDLEEDPEIPSRKRAIEVLGGAGHNVKLYLDEIAKCLEDKDWGLRRVAIECLSDLKEHGEPAAPEVARRLLHQDPDVRRAAAETLGRMGLHAGEYGHRVEGLKDTEEDLDVKQACADACEMLYLSGMQRSH